MAMSNVEILQTLRMLAHRLRDPVWLFGGVAVDFLIGRWSRPHKDIDLHAYADSRGRVSGDLEALGFRTSNDGWLTHWALGDRPWRLEVVFLERTEPNTGTLVIEPGASVGIPGRYPLLAGYLDPTRYATLDGVRFLVGSPAGEWLARARSDDLIAGRARDPKIDHDRRLLEDLLSPSELDDLRARAIKTAR
jgi:hypothetical protein